MEADPLAKYTPEYRIKQLIQKKEVDLLVDELGKLYPFLDNLAIQTLAELAVERGQDD